MITPIKLVLLLCALLNYFGKYTTGDRILAIFPVEFPSHYKIFSTVIKELAGRGHHVTIVSTFTETSTDNFKHIPIKYNYEAPEFTMEYLKGRTPLIQVGEIIDYHSNICKAAMNMPQVKEVLNHQYDVLVTEIFGCDCFMGFAYKLNIPVVGMISSTTLPWTVPMIGYYENPSYIPSYFFSFNQKMSLLERFKNTMFTIYANIKYEWSSNMKIQPFVEDIVGPLPPMRSISRNVSLILTNSHFSINQVKPTYPQLIEVGGLHIPKEIPQLPQDYEDFFKGSKAGVILFSFGTFAPVETLPKEKMDAILSVLRSLPYRIVWKINVPAENLPPNVKASPWIPQLSILCDNRTKLFISHGGMLGIQEAMYCGVPVLGIPLFADQYMNLRTLEGKGAALTLRYDDINKEALSMKIEQLFSDESYLQAAKNLSTLFKDRPQHPLETAAYWIEYIIRHKEAKHLKSPAQDLRWYQYILLDVIILLILILAFVVYALKYLFDYLISTMGKLRNGNLKEQNWESDEKKRQ